MCSGLTLFAVSDVHLSFQMFSLAAEFLSASACCRSFCTSLTFIFPTFVSFQEVDEFIRSQHNFVCRIKLLRFVPLYSWIFCSLVTIELFSFYDLIAFFTAPVIFLFCWTAFLNCILFPYCCDPFLCFFCCSEELIPSLYFRIFQIGLFVHFNDFCVEGSCGSFFLELCCVLTFFACLSFGTFIISSSFAVDKKLEKSAVNMELVRYSQWICLFAVRWL